MGEGLIDHATGCVSFKLKDPPFTPGYDVTRFSIEAGYLCFSRDGRTPNAYKNERARKIG
jgi:hypothetical protein